jgi:hypothetical protein
VKIAICASTVLILLLAVPLGIGAAQAMPSPDLQRATRIMQTWLNQTRISEHLELTKLRLNSPQSPLVNDKDKRSLQLDLRFRGADTKPDEAVKQFTTFLNQYQAGKGVSLPETVFYQLIHSCDWPRDDAVVTFIVVEDRFDISLDPDSHELVFRETQQRGPVRQVINIPLLAASKAGGANQITVKSTKAPSADALPQEIENFLKGYFVEANRAAHLKDPEFSYEPQELDYLGLKVKGVKGQVLASDKYWEKLEISFELKPASDGQKVVCYLSGEYASGIFGRLPSDDDYAAIDEAKLRDFTGNLLRKLQDHLSRSTP